MLCTALNFAKAFIFQSFFFLLIVSPSTSTYIARYLCLETPFRFVPAYVNVEKSLDPRFFGVVCIQRALRS